MAPKRRTDSDRDERLSLAGLDPEEALRALLRVDPESEPVERQNDDQDEGRGGRSVP